MQACSPSVVVVTYTFFWDHSIILPARVKCSFAATWDSLFYTFALQTSCASSFPAFLFTTWVLNIKYFISVTAVQSPKVSATVSKPDRCMTALHTLAKSNSITPQILKQSVSHPCSIRLIFHTCCRGTGH